MTNDFSGTIEIAEIQEIIEILYQSEGNGVREVTCMLYFAFSFLKDFSGRAEEMFSALDINGDGMLEEDEFVAGCMEDKEQLAALMNEGAERVVDNEPTNIFELS